MVDEIERSTDQSYSTRGRTTVQHSSADTKVNLPEVFMDVAGEVVVTGGVYYFFHRGC